MCTISLCMIVKNEESVLARCLDSVRGIADEIILVDTGSTDATKDIARRYTDKVFDFVWVDDFAAARNVSFGHAGMDYCLWLDADDVIEEADRRRFLELKRTLSPDTDIVMLPYHTAFDGEGRPTFTYYRERLIRNHPAYRWTGAVHEVIAPAGHIVYGEAAVSHRKLRPGDPGRNLRIFENLRQSGHILSPGSNSTTPGNSIITNGTRTRRRRSSTFWTRERDGWKTTSMPAVSFPPATLRWDGTKRRWPPCCAASPMTRRGPKPAATWAGIFWPADRWGPPFSGMSWP